MKRSVSIFLVIFLLIGQTGFTFATHYCGGHPVKTGIVLGDHLPDCGMNMMNACETDISDTDGPLVKKATCCENHFTTVKAKQDLLTGFIDNDFSTVNYLSIPVNIVITVNDHEVHLPHESSNSPPGFEPDIQILFQTFLL
ncbi:MAG: hypothetical protein K0B52_01645 [FCB group bacterium]|nr:hypothetical protein [FCB group bacterium]